MKTRTFLISVISGAAAIFASPAFARLSGPETSETAPASVPTKWLRVVEDEASQKLTLEVASREYSNSAGQMVSLVGAIHVGDQTYYDALQEYLDSMALVLWEGVKPEATSNAAAMSDEKRLEITTARLRMLAAMVEHHKSTHGKKYPASLDDVAAAAENQQKKLIDQVSKDAWGNPVKLVYGSGPSKRPDAAPGTLIKTMDLVSHGADGKEGGDGINADIKFSSQTPLTAAEKAGKDGGIQMQLAKALGLKFQLNAIQYERSNWRNSDMTAEALQQRMVEKGQSLDQFMGMLDGSSGMGQIAGVLLNMVGASPKMQTTVKLMMLHVLSQADDMAAMSQASGMGEFMKVIVEDRNDVVMHDLKKTLKDNPDLKTIGVFYGAGHFAGMEKTLVGDMEFTPGKQLWFPAITVDLKAAGMSMKEAQQMKAMIQGMTRDMKRQAEPR